MSGFSALFIMILLFTLSNILHTSYAQSNDDGIQVTTSSLIFDTKGQVHVFGEVMNNGESSVHNVFVTATFYDDDRSVASNYAYIQMDNLRPGEKSAFEMVLEDIVDTEESLEFDSYDLSVNSRATSAKTACLSLNVTENFLDDAGRYHIEGTVSNKGNQLTDSIRVSATFYNTTGHVTAINAVEIVDDDEQVVLHPNENATFGITGTPITGSVISSYSINVESAQYSIINDAITKDNVECPIQPSTSLTLHINGTTSDSLTQDVIVSGKIAVPIEYERYVAFEIYNQNERLYHREICKLNEDNSYLCTITFYPLNEYAFVLVAEYGGALAELTFTNSHDNNEINGNGINAINSSLGSIQANSTVVVDDGNIQPENSSIPLIPKIMLSTNLTNNNLHLQPVTLIIQIKDSNGTVVFLDFYNTILSPTENMSLANEWTLNINGIAMVEVFVWDSMGHNSQPLSEVSRRQVILTDQI